MISELESKIKEKIIWKNKTQEIIPNKDLLLYGINLKKIKHTLNEYIEKEEITNRKDYSYEEDITCMATAVGLNYLIYQFQDDKQKLDNSIQRIHEEISKSLKYISNLNNWISLEECIKVLDIIIEETGNQNAVYEMGINTYNLGSTNSVLKTIAKLLPPKTLLKKSVELSKKFNNYVNSEIKFNSNKEIIITSHYTKKELIPINKCEYEEAIYSGIPTLFGYKPWKVEQTKCIKYGDDHCEYKISATNIHNKNTEKSLIFNLKRVPISLSKWFASKTGALDEINDEVESNYQELRDALTEANEARKKEERINNRLRVFVSDNNVERIIIEDEEPELKTKKKQKTIFFSDIRDFTPMTSKLGDDLSEFLSSYFGKVGPAISSHDGQILNYIGDAILASFDNSYQAILAAVDSRFKIREFNDQRKKFKFPKKHKIDKINAGIGIATGLCYIGNIGINTKMTDTVIGNPVNLGSRLEGLTKKYNVPILIDELTSKEIPDDMIAKPRHFPKINISNIDEIYAYFKSKVQEGKIFLREIGKALPKGVSTPVKIYEVMNSYSPEIILLKTNNLHHYYDALKLYYGEEKNSKETIISNLSNAKNILEKLNVNFKENLQELRSMRNTSYLSTKDTKEGDFIYESKIAIINEMIPKIKASESEKRLWNGIEVYDSK